MWFFNAEHPWTVLYRDGIAVFLEKHSDLRKLGTKIPTEFVIHKYRLMKGDVVICGSDGRDDIELSTKDGVREINENEELFLRNVEKGKGDIRQISNEILKLGKLTDDLSLLRIGFKENMDETEQILVGDGYYDRRSYAECIPHYERALFIAPENTNVWFKLSVAYKHLGNYPESKYACLKVYHKEPERFANLINLADNFRLLHEEEDAWKFTQLAKKIAPDHESVKKLEEALSKK
jgi:tetratricopeptide (TPR) repeat protein